MLLYACTHRLASFTGHRLFKPLIFLLCLAPFLMLAWQLLNNMLGANPIETFTRRSGEWGLRFILITLAMTPLRRILQTTWPIKLRRMLGLYAFFYVCMHLLSYLVLDRFFDWPEIISDIIKRPFITIGMLAFLLLIPLAITSNRHMMRKLGKNWQRLHKLVYLIAICGVLHFFMLVKADYYWPIVYAVMLLVLLAWRMPRRCSSPQ